MCCTASLLLRFVSARLVRIDFVELLYTWNFQINFLFFLCKSLNSGLTRNAYNLQIRTKDIVKILDKIQQKNTYYFVKIVLMSNYRKNQISTKWKINIKIT